MTSARSDATESEQRRRPSIWRDAGRTVLFGRRGAAQAPQLLGEHGFASFELLTTERALAGARSWPRPPTPSTRWRRAGARGGRGAPRSARRPRLVALGGGRVIDTAKAIASVSGAAVAAIPTTLSGAEMTGIHRLPAGAENASPRSCARLW